MSETSGPAKHAAESHVQISQLMGQDHANLHGNVHGGTIMRLVDEAGAIAAIRHARRRVVTVEIDSMMFIQPIRLGNLVVLDAEVTYTGRTSIEVAVDVVAEDVLNGTCIYTNRAYAVYVALDDEGKPCPVPQLLIETEEERRRAERGRLRQQQRLQRRHAEEERFDHE